jgi:hypothetical protein
MCVIFLIDESAAMDARVADGTKSKAESVATALNSLLNQLTAVPGLDVAVVGYRRGADGDDVSCRWGGPLAGRTLVRSDELAAAPVAVEQRVRKVPAAGAGMAREETVPFPVWYVPRLGATASRLAAYQYCFGLMSAWAREEKGTVPICRNGPEDASHKWGLSPILPRPPLLISFVGELAADESLQPVVAEVQRLALPGGPPLLMHAHLSSSGRVPPTVYPSANGYLPPGAVSEIFALSSVLPDPLAAALKGGHVALNKGARGMAYNARMVDVIRFLSVVRAYAGWQPEAVMPVAAKPQAAADDSLGRQLHCRPEGAQDRGGSATATPTLTLLVLLLDRSIEQPAAGEKNAWTRLQEHANDLLGQIAKRGKGRVEVAVVSYGAAVDGSTEVQTGLAGPLAGRAVVTDAELAAGPLRVEEVTEKVSNGIGGLVEFTRKKPIFIDLPPTAAAFAATAVQAASQLAGEWTGQHAGTPVRTILLHLTRGRFDPAERPPAADGVLEYFLIVTESPHRSLSYPGVPERIDDPLLRQLWQRSSLLLGAEHLAAERPALTADARGIVINAKFDLLLDGL